MVAMEKNLCVVCKESLDEQNVTGLCASCVSRVAKGVDELGKNASPRPQHSTHATPEPQIAREDY